MKPLLAIGLFAAILYGAIRLGKHLGIKRDPKRKQHNHKLNPYGFDDGYEDDNHLHI